MVDLLLKNGTVITMNKERDILLNHSVVVDKGKILEIGPDTYISEKYQAKEIIDCEHKVIMPGLIDAHGHAGHSMFKTIAMESLSYWMPIMTKTYKNYVSDDFWYYEGRLSALERLKAGITTGVSVMGSMPRCDDPIFSINHAKGYAEIGIRDIVCTGPCNPPWPHTFSRIIDEKIVTKEVTYNEALLGAEAAIEALNNSNNGKTKAFITPFVIVTSVDGSNSTTPDKLLGLTNHDKLQAKRIREIARKYDTRIHSDAFGGMIHLAYQDKENCLLGPDVHLQHCRGISFDEAMILAKTGTNVTTAPGVSQAISQRTPIVELMEMGANVAITTDGTAPSAPFDMFQAMRKTQMVHQAGMRDTAYLPVGKLLEMVTVDAAKAIGMEDVIGSIESGKKADIITVNMLQPHLAPEYMHVHRLVHQAVGSDVDNVIVDGEILMKDRIVLNKDEKKIILEATEESNRTIDRAGLRKYMQPTKSMWGHTRMYVDEKRYEE